MDLVTSEIKSKVVDVTPEMARKWLSLSGGNRRIHPDRVNAYVRDMMVGRWYLVNELKFDKNGVFIDGHHTLHAIIQYGSPVKCRVGTGFNPESILGIDMGQPRKYDQVSVFTGECFSKRHFSVARIMQFGAGAGKISTGYISYSEMRDYVLKYEDAINFVVLNGRKAKYVTSPILAVVGRAYYSRDRDRLIEFLNVLETGLARSEDDWGASRLRNFIQDAERLGHRASPGEVYWRAESAVFHFCKRTKVKVLRPASQELFPLKLDANGAVVPE